MIREKFESGSVLEKKGPCIKSAAEILFCCTFHPVQIHQFLSGLALSFAFHSAPFDDPLTYLLSEWLEPF